MFWDLPATKFESVEEVAFSLNKKQSLIQYHTSKLLSSCNSNSKFQAIIRNIELLIKFEAGRHFAPQFANQLFA